jgi:hypothetical protein
MTLLRIGVALLGFLVVGVAFLPLRLVFDRLPLPSAQVGVSSISGSIWRGRLEGVTLEGEPLGAFDLRTEAWPLLSGRLRVNFVSDGPLTSGQLAARGGSLMLLNLNGETPLSRFAPSAPAEAMLSVRNAGLDLDGARCKRAGGQTTLTGLSSLGIGDLAGPVSCEAGRLVLQLAPQAGGPGVDILLDPAAAGGNRVTARSQDAIMQAAITGLGLSAEEPPRP